MTEYHKQLIDEYIEHNDLQNPFIIECEFFKEYQNNYDAFFVTANDSHQRTWVYMIVFGGNVDEDNNMYIEQINPIV